MVRRLVASLIVFAAFGAPLLAQQDQTPREPFRTVHLLALKSDADVAAVQAWVMDVNAAMDKMGGGDAKYRLFKVAGKQAGNYNHLLESSWSGGEMYDKVHKSADWQAIGKKHPKVDEFFRAQVYNRYVEVQPMKR